MTNKPKIQLHLPNLYVGGIERWALTLLQGLPDFDWYISTPPGAISHQAGLEAFGLYELVHETEHAIPMDALITTWGAANRSIAPTIAVAHSAFQKYREMMQAVRYDFAVAVSKAARTCFPETAKVDVIYNGVDVSRLQVSEPRSSVRARLGIPDAAVVAGYVGRWGYQKNPLAAAIAASSIPGGVALYVGPFPDDAVLLAQAQRLAPCCFVRPEEVGRIGDIYAAMDVCVFASRSEGFGLAIAEAWYCRVPVVATRVGIVAEHPDLAVLLPDDPTAADLAGAVSQALSTVSQTKRIDLARQVIFEKYSASAMVNQWKSYLESKLR